MNATNNTIKKVTLANEFTYKVKNHLRSSINRCESRGLMKASNWALEQIMGMNHQLDDDPSLQQFQQTYQQSITNEYNDISISNVDHLLFAKSLIVSKEYQRCSHLLMNIPSLQSNNLSIFLIAYAQYMAGEKLKDQKILEMNKVPTDKSYKEKAANNNVDGSNKKTNNITNETERNYLIKNTHLHSVYNNLVGFYKNGVMKNDGFLLYIFAIVTRDLHRHEGIAVQDIFQSMKMEGTNTGEDNIFKGHAARQLLLESLHVYPWNWSCWLELSELCITEKQPIPQWEQITNFQSIMRFDHNNIAFPMQNEIVIDWDCAKIMYACFLIHTYLEKHNGELAMQVLQSTLPILPNSLTILTQIGLAQYTLRLYDEAEFSFNAVRSVDPYRLCSIDTYSNILYVKEKSAELSYLAHTVIEVEKFCPETCCVVGNYYSLKGQHDRAVIYFQRALKLNPRYLSAWTLMGHEYMELRNTAAAVQCYRNAVHISEVDYRAWYGLGQTYEMLHLYQYANYYYRKAATLRPDDARMWSAVGNCLLKLAPSNIGSARGSRLRLEAIRSFERAVSCGDKEGIATRDLARLCREEGDAEKTAKYFLTFLHTRNTFENQNNSFDNGDLVNDSFNFTNAPIDGDQAEALLFMAYYYKSRGELSSAEVFCNRIIGFVGTESEEARAILRDIRTLLLKQNNNPTRNRKSSMKSPTLTSKVIISNSNQLSNNTYIDNNNMTLSMEHSGFQFSESMMNEHVNDSNFNSSIIYSNNNNNTINNNTNTNNINNNNITNNQGNIRSTPQRQRRLSSLHPSSRELNDSLEETPSQSLQLQYISLQLGDDDEQKI